MITKKTNKNDIMIVDFSHLWSRSLFASISNTKPRILNGKYVAEDFVPMFKYTIFSILARLNQSNYNKNVDLLLAIDSGNYWRADISRTYKGERKLKKEEDLVDWKEVKSIVNDLIIGIKENLPFIVIEVDKAEADCISGVLSKYCSEFEKIKVTNVTSDHDWKQNLIYENVSMYDDIKKKNITLTDWEKEMVDSPIGEISKFTLMHSLIGDAGDGVNNCVFETEFSNEFKKYLISKGYKNEDFKNTIVDGKSISGTKKIIESEKFEKLVEDFDVYEYVKSGKKAGEYRIDVATNKPKKKIWKKVRMGEKTAKKIIDDNSLNDFLSSNEMYLSKFLLSNKLVDFRNIPSYISDNIIDAYKSYEIKEDLNKIENFFHDIGLIDFSNKAFLFSSPYGNSKEKMANKDGFYNPFL